MILSFFLYSPSRSRKRTSGPKRFKFIYFFNNVISLFCVLLETNKSFDLERKQQFITPPHSDEEN